VEGFQRTKTYKKKCENFRSHFANFFRKKWNEEKFSHNFGFLFNSEFVSRNFYIYFLAKILHFFAKQIEAKFPRERFFLFAENPTPPPNACFGCYCVCPGMVVYVACVSWYFLALCNLLNLIFANTSLYVRTNKYKEI